MANFKSFLFFNLLVLCLHLHDVTAVQCGISPGSHSRIVGGEEARPHQFPWMVKVRVEAIKNSDHSAKVHFQCGGEVIDSQFIVTAGHCFEGEAGYTVNFKGTEVILGAHNLSDAHEGHIVAKADKVFVHPGFAAKHIGGSVFVENDITLIKLAEAIDFVKQHNKIAPICLPVVGQVVSKSECQIVGWGRVASNERNHGPLKYADVNLLTAAECNHFRVGKHQLDDMNVCAGYRNHHTCRGDSGGPLQCPNSSGQWVLVGIDSFGPSVCEVNSPSTFVNIVKHLDWINSIRSSH